jgi:chromosomal replication initiator protein
MTRILHGPNVRRVVFPILEKHKLSWDDVYSYTRKAPVVACRHEVFRELKKELQWSASRIARLCNKDHTTVIYALRKGNVAR